MAEPAASAVAADDWHDAVGEDLVVVSNRQPYRHEEVDGELRVERPSGGLVAALDPVMRSTEGTWIAWGDGPADHRVTDEDGTVDVPPEDPRYTLRRVTLEDDLVAGYYDGYANQSLWPLCHTVTGPMRFDRDHWECYREANERFAEAAIRTADASSTVWLQDYHLALAPRRIATATDAMVMQFWHVPWPAPDVFRVCPHHAELLEGLLGSDLLGFHLERYCGNFLECVDRLLPEAAVDRYAGTVRHRDTLTRVRSFPLGVAVEDHAELAAAADPTAATFRRSAGIDPGRPIVLGVDRLDYTKGIPERLAALERLWEREPARRGAFTYVQKGVPTRQRVPAYRRHRRRIDEAVERINDRFGTADWQPVHTVTEYLSRSRLSELYRAADVALVTPLRDGMNLVAQEYVACQTDGDGVLVLSEFAGAHEHLGAHALTVNPHATDDLADAVAQALDMSSTERTRRMEALAGQVRRLDIHGWLSSVLEEAATVRFDRTRREPVA